jgi:cold-inducible RNA-binding protein
MLLLRAILLLSFTQTAKKASITRLITPAKEIRMKIYVGNLSYEVTEGDLQRAFESFGRVESAEIIKDRDSGMSKGFGFVEMPDAAEARAAIDGLNGKELKGRAATVNEARPRPEARPGRGGRGGRRPFKS